MNFLCEQTDLEAARSLGRLRRICIYFRGLWEGGYAFPALLSAALPADRPNRFLHVLGAGDHLTVTPGRLNADSRFPSPMCALSVLIISLLKRAVSDQFR